MIEILDLDMFIVYHVKYIQKYWVIGKMFDTLEHECQSMSEAISMAQAYNGAVGSYMALESD